MKRLVTLLPAILSLLLAGCVHKPVRTVAKPEQNGRYVTAFPFHNASDRLEVITQSVSKLIVVAYYKIYQFDKDDHLNQYSLSTRMLKKNTASITDTHESISGTATLISYDNGKVALLTCAHILDFPDTVISYFDASQTLSTNEIRSVSIKVRQENYCRSLPGCGPMNILAMDREADVAIIGHTCNEHYQDMKIFGCRAGHARELGWGSAAYVIGYPMGNLMVTHGIVSDPNSDESGSFMIDALFNKGFSGGIILAERDSTPNFELVGMVRSAYSRKEYMLKPEKEMHEFSYNSNSSYTGEIRVGTEETINYGVTYAISIESLRAFYRKYRAGLIQSGYNLDPFFLAGEK